MKKCILSNCIDKTYKKTKYKASIEYINKHELDLDGEENTVKLIFEEDDLMSPNFTKKYISLYERQQLILKSLYDIRRYRLNNKDVFFKEFY